MRFDGLKMKSETHCALLCWRTPKYILEFRQIKEKPKGLAKYNADNGRFSFSGAILRSFRNQDLKRNEP